jgi:methylmalonyl-CoA mutase N-terminal domain/subunit
METLFAGIPLADVSTSMTINSPAAILLAFYLCVGEEQDVTRDRLRGTIQTDILRNTSRRRSTSSRPSRRCGSSPT